jgi:tetratricopeptide (TPR) repeat protein
MFSEKRREGASRVMAPARPGLKAAGFLMPKPPGTLRVFVLGESVAGLLADPRYPGLQTLAGPGVEVINCGMGAYDSRRLLSAFRELSGYEPDLIIVMSGNNELGSEVCPGWRADLERAKRAAKLKLKGLFSDASGAERAARFAIHRQRLLEMAALARAKGFPVLFCTLPANEKDFPPYGVVVSTRAGFGAREGLSGTRDPFAHYRLARELEAAGDLRGAKAQYDQALEADPLGDRCSPSHNAMIREAAAAGGACLGDLEKDFAGIAPGGIVGGGLLADGVHWHYPLNTFVAARLWEHIAACPSASARFFPAGPPAGFEAGLKAAEEKTLAGLKSREYLGQAARNSAYYAAACLWQGLPELKERAVGLLGAADSDCRPCLLAELRDRGAFLKGIPSNLWVGGMRGSSASWWRPLLEAAAEMWRRKGAAGPAAEAAALADREARPVPAAPAQRPGLLSEKYKRRSAELSDSAAKKLAAGDLAGARKELLEAVGVDPDDIGAQITLCSVLLLLKEPSAALEACGAAVSAARFPSPGALVLPRMLPDAFALRA